ncbi:hypothetical protein IFM89_009849 [Coptis chinensis]|uniref:C2H2-type domain-containing protein n=1 Tax=Coptis chinensis TaxID=261450 RepID=A0A835LUA8_9MAGN|nr:hypothetical protein IFM89_009849 [Coptis chinensis]
MDLHSNNNNPFDRRPILKSKAPAHKWVKEWVPQEVVSNGGRCLLLRWVKVDVLKELKEKPEEAEAEEEPEPMTEVLFLCSYEGCGKTFVDAGALRKHSHIHGERQYICHYEGCGKKFLDSSKLKRHFLIHTGERHFVCPHEGCGKAFSLDFNLRAHMRTHSQENYHICPYVDCGKRYAHEYKLKTHIKAHHEKHTTMDMIIKRTPISEKHTSTPKTPAVAYGSASSDRPYACPYEGYNDMDEGSDQDAYPAKGSGGKISKQSKQQVSKMPPSKSSQKKGSSVAPTNLMNVVKQQWPVKDVSDDEDSEETEEDNEDVEDGWRNAENEDDEMTEDEE